MFRDTICETPFTNQIANGCFTNITGNSYHRDTTFLASIRALVAPRINEGESVTLSFTSSDYSADALSGSYKRLVTAVYREDEVEDGNITIHSFNHNPETNEAWLDKMKESFTKVYKDYVMIDKFTLFFSKTFYVLCFVNVEHRKVVIFCDALENRTMHYLQLSIPIFLPWYFSEDKAIDKESDEFALLHSFKEKTPEKYLELMNKLAEPYDFRTAKIKTLLRDFETRYERAERENVRNRINSVISEIDSYNTSIRQLLDKKRDYEIRLLGLETKINNGEENSEIMDFFLCNKNITLDSTEENGDMYFTVKATLENFDEDAAERYIANEDSFVYKPNGRPCNNYIPSEDMERLMRAIFLDQILTVRFCAKYRFNISGDVRGLDHCDYSAEYNTYMPNPHIHYYHCIGGYSSIINEMLRDNNYIGALSQCIASCSSLNWYDGTVMGAFIKSIYGFGDYNVNNRCIELPDGTVVNPHQAIDWLKSQETEQEGENNE